MLVRQTLDDVRPAVMGRSLPLVQVHGDFKGANLLWSNDGHRIAAVVDWDLAAPGDLPVIDFAFFGAYERSALQHCSFGAALAHEALIRSGTDYHAFAFGELRLTEGLYALCVLMALIRYANLNAGFQSRNAHRLWCERHVNEGLRSVAEVTSAIVRRNRH
jgi:aminoglycoside phosphotransferase (APT) family kinase protein